MQGWVSPTAYGPAHNSGRVGHTLRRLPLLFLLNKRTAMVLDRRQLLLNATAAVIGLLSEGFVVLERGCAFNQMPSHGGESSGSRLAARYSTLMSMASSRHDPPED
jgi:hypothetical protein